MQLSTLAITVTKDLFRLVLLLTTTLSLLFLFWLKHDVRGTWYI